jgi:hypothetical protein
MSNSLTPSELTALAILKTGGSFLEAADVSGLTLKQVRKLWDENNQRKNHEL